MLLAFVLLSLLSLNRLGGFDAIGGNTAEALISVGAVNAFALLSPLPEKVP